VAFSEVETTIANPARGKRKNVARRMSLKQRLHFGTARQRAAAKQALRGKRRSKANPRRKPRATHKHRARRRSNPGEIIAMTLGNPARKRRRSKMAATKTRRRRHNAGTRRRSRRAPVAHRRRRQSNPARRHHVVRHRRRNPAGVGWNDMLMLGAGGLVGGALPSAGTQLVLGASNSGVLGYGVNLVATFVMAWVGGMFTRNKAFPAGILAGGLGSLMRRIIADYSLLGGASSSLGMGDYMVSNWVAPQRLVSDFRSLTDANMGQGIWGQQGAVISSSGVDASQMGVIQGGAQAGY